MKSLIQKLFDIREGEALKASLMFAYIFLIIAALLIVKPVRNSLFLTQIGISKLPYVFLYVAIAASIFINLYLNLAQQIRLDTLIFYSTILSMLIFLGFWGLIKLGLKVNWFYYALYVWVALFGVFMTSQFWLLANYVFNAREAKRLFGFIGAGAVSGGIFGGYLTRLLAPVIGTSNMIFF